MSSPPATLFSRYDVLQRLGQGSAAVVYGVVDRLTGARLALKVAHTSGVDSPGLSHEFALLRRFAHPGVVRAVDYLRVPDGEAFTLGWLTRGVEQRSDETPLAAHLASIAVGCLSALAPLHDAGLWHADISPDNLRQDERGVVKLIDLGMAARGGADGISGTLAHMAPEILEGEGGDARADLFSLGSTLYQVATGQPLYDGGDVASLWEQKSRGAGERLRQAGLPGGWAAFIERLTQPEPGHRPADAWDALGLVESCATELGVPDFLRRPSLPSIFAPPGGEALEPVVSAVASGDKRVLRVEVGGEDAAALSEALCARIQLTVGSAVRVSGPQSVQVQLEWARGWGVAAVVCQRSRLGSRCDAGVEERMEGDGPTLVLLEDELGAGGGSPASSDRGKPAPHLACPPLTQTRLTVMAREVFGDVGPELAPAIMEVSGGQPFLARAFVGGLIAVGALYRVGRKWGVDPSRLQEAVASAPQGLVAWMTSRSTGLDAQSESLLAWLAVSSRPMGIVAVAEMAGIPLETAVARLGLLERRGLVDAGPLGVRPSPSAFGPWLRARIPPEKRALMHRHFADVLARGKLLGSVAPELRERVYHLVEGRAPEAVEIGMQAAAADEAARAFGAARDLYRRLIPLAEGAERQQVELRLGWARCAAALGEHGDAVEALSPVAGSALGNAPPEAGQTAGIWGSGLRRRVLQGFGTALSRSGRWEEAREALDAVALLLDDTNAPSEHLGVALDRALISFYTGDLTGAESTLRAALVSRKVLTEEADNTAVQLAPDEGLRLPAFKLLHLLGAVLWQGGRLADAEALMVSALRALGREPTRPELTPIVDDALGEVEANLWVVLGNTVIDQGRPAEARAILAAPITFYEETGRTQAASRCYNNLAVDLMALGHWAEAIELWERFRQLSAEGGDAADLALVLNNLGNAYLLQGRWERAEQRLAQALASSEEAGFARIRGQVLGNLGELAAKRGRHEEAMEINDRALDVSRRLGLRDDELENLRRRAELLVDLERWGEAEEFYDLALPLAREVGNAAEEGVLLGLGGLLGVMKGEERAGLEQLRRAAELLRSRSKLNWAQNQARLAQALAHVDRLDEAEAVLARARATFKELGALGELGRLERQAEALDRMDGFSGGSRRSLRILLDVAQSLARVLELEELLDLIVAKSLEVTGAQRGFVILVDGEGQPTFRAARHMGRNEVARGASQISSTVVRRVLSSGEPFAVTNVEDDLLLSAQESVRELGLRSIMAAPLLRSGQVLGTIYVDSPYVLRRFRGKELEMLGALAEAAAVAVENAKLYDDLKRKTELMYYMAHEFRNPLSAVMAFSQLIEAGGDNLRADQREYLGIISDSGQRLSRMVTSVLELAKLEANRIEWAATALDLSPLAQATTRALSPLAEKRGVRLEVEAPPSPQIYGNTDRLAQVITNLVGNAIKFVDEGGWVCVSICGVSLADFGRSEELVQSKETWISRSIAPGLVVSTSQGVLLTVCDDGPGVPEDQLVAIFEQFSQTGDARSRKKGTGLGLAICKEIVEHHGGWIWAENRQPTGARLCVLLPVAEREDGPLTPDAP